MWNVVCCSISESFNVVMMAVWNDAVLNDLSISRTAGIDANLTVEQQISKNTSARPELWNSGKYEVGYR